MFMKLKLKLGVNYHMNNTSYIKTQMIMLITVLQLPMIFPNIHLFSLRSKIFHLKR